MDQLLRSLKSILNLLGPAPDSEQINEPDYDLALVVQYLLKVLKRYFRGKVLGLEKIPPGPALIVGNHNAGITAIEPILLGLEWYLASERKEFIRYLGHDMMALIPVLGNFLVKLGMIRADPEVASRALAEGHKVMVFPGGNYEAFRTYRERHRIDFKQRTGFVELALRNRVPIVPALCLGGHETLYVISSGRRFAEWSGVKRILRSDSFPLFIGLPWGLGIGPLFHLPLPAQLLVEIGEPISLNEYGPEALDNKEVLREISDLVRQRLQQMMDRRVS